MSELTPEEVRAAAVVLVQYVAITDPIEHKNTHRVAVSADMLNDYADQLERKLSVEQELAEFVRSERCWGAQPLELARALLARYPALAEQIREESL